jgi:hypothetical protein
MSVISTSDVTPPDSDTKDRWALNLPYVWVGGSRVQIKGGLPTWHPTIHFVGYAGLTRTLLALFGPASVVSSVLAYGLCVMLAMITGKLIQKSKGERVPRICSATLGMMGFTFGTISQKIPQQHGTVGVWAALVVPLSAAAFMIVVNLVGEMLICWFPARVPEGVQIVPNRRSHGWFRRARWTTNPA